MRKLLDFDVAKRTQFANWEQALRGLIDRIEGVGVLVAVNGIVGSNTHRKLDPEEFRGFALADRLAPLIFVNGADTKAAQIFTLIHELAHIWLGESALSDASMAAATMTSAERWCNQVAAEVLVPAAALRADYRGQATQEELERLARQYRVSTLVVLKRIFDVGKLPWQQYRELYDQEQDRILGLMASRRGSTGGGNYYFTQPLRLSRRFSQAVIASTLEGSTTYREAYQLLGVKRHDTFEKLADTLGAA